MERQEQPLVNRKVNTYYAIQYLISSRLNVLVLRRPPFFYYLLFLFINLFLLNSTWAEASEMGVTVYAPAPQKVSDPQQLENLKKNLIKYNKKEYLTAYNVFLMNGNVEFGYIVAKKAVEQRPQSIFWRKKLLQTALWANYPETALTQYLYFISKNIETITYTEEALKLAVQLNNFDVQALLVRSKLLKTPHDKNLSVQYSKILQNQGYPREALKFLQQLPDVDQDAEYLKELVSTANGLDEPDLALQYARKLWVVDKHSSAAIHYAELLYLKGDLKGAYRLYSSAAKNAGDNPQFWRSYADISLLAGENYAAIHAYQQLLYKKSISQPALLELIRMEDMAGQAESAYKDANFAYQKYQYPQLIPIILELGERLKKWQEIKAFIVKIPPNELAKLEEKPQFALLVISISSHLNLDWEVHQKWLWVFQRWPNLTIMQRSYLWYLIDGHDIQQLEYSLKRWHKILRKKRSLWQPYSAALTNTGNYVEALQVMLEHKREVDTSYELLTNMADLFVQTNHPFTGYYLSRRAFNLLTAQIHKQHERLTLEQHLILTELMQSIAPAPLTYSFAVKPVVD